MANNTNSQFISASKNRSGAPNITGRPVFIDEKKFLAAGGKILEYKDIAADLDRMVAADPSLKARVDAWKKAQVFEKEVLLEGKVPESAVKSANAMRLTKGLRVVGFIGIAVSAYDLGKAGVESYQQGSPKPLVKQGVRTVGGFAGAWAGAKVGAAVGAALGVETGPGAIVTGAVGGLAGGIAGYFGADWVASLID